MSIVRPPDDGRAAWSVDTQQRYARYYQSESGGAAARARAAAIHARVSAALAQPGAAGLPLRVAEIGCGDGTGCRLWAERGHEVFGADTSAALVKLARQRAFHAGLDIAFVMARDGALPWGDASMDLCIGAGLLDDAPDWRACVAEMVRVLKPGGALYLASGNSLRTRRRHGTRAQGNGVDPADTARTRLSYRSLRTELAQRGFVILDRFDLAARASRRPGARAALAVLRALPPLRLCGQLASREIIVLAFKPGVPD